ncbi:MAG: hypothetical protein R2746_17375 [Acidimicrobiales bacterium]
MTRPIALTVALALVLTACSGSSDADGAGRTTTTAAAERSTTSAPAPTGPEPTELTVVPLPDTVLAARYDNWTADRQALVFSAVPAGSERVELYWAGIDGSDLACLTCDLARPTDDPLLKALPFSDGKRILVRVGEQSLGHQRRPRRDHLHAVGGRVRIGRLHAHRGARRRRRRGRAAPAGVRIAPDGVGVGFTRLRTAADGDEAFTSVVGALRLDGDRYVVDHPRVVSTQGELKNFTPDGRHVLIAAFTTLPDQAANPDIVQVDLGNGDVERVTTSPDYDEDISLSPDQRSYVVFSGRGSHLFETASQVARPNFIGPGLAGLFGYLFVAHRKELLEPYLVGVGAEQQGEEGQLLNPDSAADGWDGRTLASWSPDGTAVSFWEDKGDPFSAPTADSTRLVVVRLTDREPVARHPAHHPRARLGAGAERLRAADRRAARQPEGQGRRLGHRGPHPRSRHPWRRDRGDHLRRVRRRRRLGPRRHRGCHLPGRPHRWHDVPRRHHRLGGPHGAPHRRRDPVACGHRGLDRVHGGRADPPPALSRPPGRRIVGPSSGPGPAPPTMMARWIRSTGAPSRRCWTRTCPSAPV